MQVETKSDHWPTYTWRPFIGFCFGLLGLSAGITVGAAYAGVIFFRIDPAVLAQLPGTLGAEAAKAVDMLPLKRYSTRLVFAECLAGPSDEAPLMEGAFPNGEADVHPSRLYGRTWSRTASRQYVRLRDTRGAAL
jgi:hypothetical protein